LRYVAAPDGNRSSSNPVALSTASVFPERVPDAFQAAAQLGFDGIEIMVTTDPVSQDGAVLARLSEFHGVPVVAVHAPNLLVTQRVWGLDAWGKLVRSQELAQQLGARVVVVHPPFRWQREYAAKFEARLTRMSQQSGIAFAVENLYPLRSGTTEVSAYAPHWNPVELDVPYATLDVSHASVSGSDVQEMAAQLSSRLAHLHLGDGSKPGLPDEHLVPGRGNQPCAELLGQLRATGYAGAVVLEVNTRKSAGQRLDDLAESLEFARRHLSGVPTQTAPR
jgi:sugar phosphate isomerase/epimerase